MKTITLSLFSIVLILGCSKSPNTAVIPEKVNPLTPQHSGVMVICLLGNSGYALHPEAVVFRPGYNTTDFNAKRRIDTMNDAYYFSHYRLLWGITDTNYPHPNNHFRNDTCWTLGYGVPAIQSATFINWFNKFTLKWLGKHECIRCDSVVVHPGNDTTLEIITCNVNKN